jgi:hypothetical protein
MIPLAFTLRKISGGAALGVLNPPLLGPVGLGAFPGTLDLPHHLDMRVFIWAFNGERPG